MKASWQIAALGDVLRYRKEFIEINDLESYRRCRVKLHAQGVVLRDIARGAEIKTKKQQVCSAGEFLVAEIDAKVGGFGIVPPELDGAIVSSHYFLFEIDETKLNRRFLDFYIRTPSFRDQVTAQGSTNYAAVRPNEVLGYRLPLPALEEQRRIVTRIEELAAKIEEARGLRWEAQLFTSVWYNAERDLYFRQMNCARRPIAELFDLINGRAFKPSEWKTEGQKIIRIQNLKYPDAPYNYFDGAVHEKHVVRKEDVLFAWSGQIVSLGAHIWQQEEAILNQHIFNVKAKQQMLARFIQEGFNFLIDEMKHQVRGLEMFHIRKQELDRLLFPIPPFEEQRRIVAYLDDLQAKVGELKRLQAETAAELDALLPSVLDRAFRGEL